MKVLLTGGAGFIGSNLAAELLRRSHSVTVFDDLSLGRRENLETLRDRRDFVFIEGDLLDADLVKEAMKGQDLVFHLAANSDISYGTKFTDVDLKKGTLATYNVLEAMRLRGVRQLIFASTSAVYGEATLNPTPEDYGPLFPISLYGASKLACEGLIAAFCHNFGVRAWIFRFGNIVGRNGTHGVIIDFIKKLKDNPNKLHILGDGKQSKPYLHVNECVGGMLHGYERSLEPLNFFNLACSGGTPIRFIAEALIREMGLKDVSLEFTGGSRGWTGDVPFVRLDPAKMAAAGWTAKYTSDEAVMRAIRELVAQNFSNDHLANSI